MLSVTSQNMAVEWVTFLRIREGVGQLQISTCKLFNQVYHSFPQSLRANEIPRLFSFTVYYLTVISVRTDGQRRCMTYTDTHTQPNDYGRFLSAGTPNPDQQQPGFDSVLSASLESLLHEICVLPGCYSSYIGSW